MGQVVAQQSCVMGASGDGKKDVVRLGWRVWLRLRTPRRWRRRAADVQVKQLDPLDAG